MAVPTALEGVPRPLTAATQRVTSPPPPTRRQSDVFVLDDATRILALSDGALRKLSETDPALAAKLQSNVSALLWSRLRDLGHLTG